MSDYALVNNTKNKVENIIHWDGVLPWESPEGYTLVNIVGKEVGINFTYVDGEFIQPEEKPKNTSAPTLEELQAQLLIITQQMAALANTSG